MDRTVPRDFGRRALSASTSAKRLSPRGDPSPSTSPRKGNGPKPVYRASGRVFFGCGASP